MTPSSARSNTEIPPFNSRTCVASDIAAADGCCWACALGANAAQAMTATPRMRAIRRTNMAAWLLVNLSRSRPLDDANAGGSGEYDGLCEPDKETVLDDAGNGG